jgi:mannose-6-phosphate isomerase class I
MARSDNMIAHGSMSSMGLPPQDASLFASNLLAEPGPSSRLELKHEVWSSRIKYENIELYKIPMEEFDILHLTLKGKRTEIIERGIDGPSIWIVVKGTIEIEVVNNEKGKQTEKLKTGQIVFVKPTTELKFTDVGDEDAEAWAAFCEA